MRIDKNETILGYKMTLIRDLLRRISSRIWTDGDIAAHFHIPIARAEQLADALIRRGLLTLKPDAEGNERDLVVTDLGQRLCAARFLKPIARSRADAIIADTLVRIEAINARDELVYRIAEAHVFGSYFRGEAEVSDVDLAVRLARRRPGSKLSEENMDRVRASGQVSLTFLRMLTFGSNEVLKLLRGGARHLHVTPWDVFEELGRTAARQNRRTRGGRLHRTGRCHSGPPPEARSSRTRPVPRGEEGRPSGPGPSAYPMTIEPVRRARQPNGPRNALCPTT
ncbi:nucleotidyltransferase domain-containing protein [Rhodoplanes sp. SY1]|uniref:nucleotidyltransferase domain-containing protein n=1 Tax=Rhodoplanes sp. SY1 TaxID=3166646 RepID=UPI0038B43319